jgi:hypothetical protein
MLQLQIKKAEVIPSILSYHFKLKCQELIEKHTRDQERMNELTFLNTQLNK